MTEQITIEYNPNDIVARKAIDLILSIASIKVKQEEEPYNPEFVAKIEKSRKSKGKKVDIEELWK